MGRAVADYGGSRGGSSRRPRMVRVENCRSFRCFDCKRITFVPLFVVARGTVHCRHCGGATEETAASFRRQYGRSAVGTANNPHDSHPLECPECDKRFRSKVGLKLHLEDSHAYEKDVAPARQQPRLTGEMP